MKVAVIGSTGGSGRAAVEALLATGHLVTAFSRRPETIELRHPRLRFVSGDALDPGAIAAAVTGQDAVVVALGITENFIRVRLFGPARTPIDVRSRGTANVIAAMREHGVRRLVVLSSYGVGETRDRLRFVDRMFFELLLKPQIADSEVQNDLVASSDLDWVLAQPVHLTNAVDDAMPYVSASGETGKMSISRKSVARFLAAAVESPTYVGRSVALSTSAAST